MPKLVQGGSVEFDELDDSPQVGLTAMQRSARRRGRIAWSDINAAIAELIPPLSTRPARFPGVASLIVQKVEFTPDTDIVGSDCTGDVKIHARAICTIDYATPLYDPDSGNLLEWSRDYGGQLLTIPGGSFVWDSDDKDIEFDDVRPAIVIPETVLTITQHRLAAADVPRSAIRAAANRVNASTWNGYGAETVLYCGARETNSLNALGQLETQVSHKAIVRDFIDDGVSVTHQHLWRPDTKKFERLKRKDSAPEKFLYETTDALDDVFYTFT